MSNLSFKTIWRLSTVSLLIMLLCTTSGFDSRPIKQQLTGTWELIAVDYLIKDTLPEEPPREYVTLAFTLDGTYTQFFGVGSNVYDGEYTIPDPKHIKFINQNSPINKSMPPHTVEFQIHDDILILTDISLHKYQRMKP